MYTMSESERLEAYTQGERDRIAKMPYENPYDNSESTLRDEYDRGFNGKIFEYDD